MTVAELRHLTELLAPDTEVELRVEVDTKDEENTKVERVPLDAEFRGWAECSNCGAKHKYSLATPVRDRRTIRGVEAVRSAYPPNIPGKSGT